MSPDGSLYFQGGWNLRALIALAGAGVTSIGLSVLGATGIIHNGGDWGWLVGAVLGGVFQVLLMRGVRSARSPQPEDFQRDIGFREMAIASPEADLEAYGQRRTFELCPLSATSRHPGGRFQTRSHPTPFGSFSTEVVPRPARDTLSVYRRGNIQEINLPR